MEELLAKLNEKELQVLKVTIALAMDETGGEFTFSDDVTKKCQKDLGMSRQQASGYMASLNKKNVLISCETDEGFDQVGGNWEFELWDYNEYFEKQK